MVRIHSGVPQYPVTSALNPPQQFPSQLRLPTVVAAFRRALTIRTVRVHRRPSVPRGRQRKVVVAKSAPTQASTRVELRSPIRPFGPFYGKPFIDRAPRQFADLDESIVAGACNSSRRTDGMNAFPGLGEVQLRAILNSTWSSVALNRNS